MHETPIEPGQWYLSHASSLIDRALQTQWEHIRAAGQALGSALLAGHELHAFGSGHSNLLAEELFYRAGGLADVRPIFFEAAMVHGNAALSTRIERLPGLARLLLEDHGVHAGDVLLVFSNSGRNAITTELATEAKARGVLVVAVTSLRHSLATNARSGGQRLFEIADIVIDNGGAPGDAAVEIPGADRVVAPTSTVVGAAIVNAIVAQAVATVVEGGGRPRIFTSANLDSGDAANDGLLEARA